MDGRPAGCAAGWLACRLVERRHIYRLQIAVGRRWHLKSSHNSMLCVGTPNRVGRASHGLFCRLNAYHPCWPPHTAGGHFSTAVHKPPRRRNEAAADFFKRLLPKIATLMACPTHLTGRLGKHLAFKLGRTSHNGMTEREIEL